MTLKSNKGKVGLNALANRLSVLNGKIPLNWLRLNLDLFKIKFKTALLKLQFATKLVHAIKLLDQIDPNLVLVNYGHSGV